MTACRRYPADQGQRTSGGYVRVTFGAQRYDELGRKRGREYVMLHRWVVEQVDGPLPPWPECVVMHSCDTPDCFLYEHLSASTSIDNNRDCVAKGRHVSLRGEAHGLTTLTDGDVRAIRRAVADGASARSTAARFAVCATTVRNIVARRTWSHLA